MSRIGLFVAGALLGTQVATAAVITTLASDPGAMNRAQATNSVAAETNFINLVGAGRLVTFDNLDAGYPQNGFMNLNVDVPNNIMMGIQFNSGSDPGTSGINIDDANRQYGFNISNFVGVGAKHLRFGPYWNNTQGDAELTLTFNTPISSFSTYITGSQATLPGLIQIFYNDGSSNIVPFATVSNGIPRNSDVNGGVQFFALITDTPITSITFRSTGSANFQRDLIGLDDIRLGLAGDVGGVPEPSTLALMGAGAVLIALRRRKA